MPAQPKRIVVGYDASEGSRKVLEAAVQLMGYGSTMTVVYVESAGSAAGSILEEARDFLLGQLITANYVRRQGDPADEIVGVAAELEADVIVVGRSGPGQSNGSVPESVSADVVQRADCDVLVVG